MDTHVIRASGVPKGVICLWSGAIANIPGGWHLCDGAAGTVDLRDTFIVGAKQDDAGVPKTNITGALTQSGGSVTHNHTIPQLGLDSHSAAYGTGGQIHVKDLANNLSIVHASGGGSNQAVEGETASGYNSGSSGTLPSYYALAYIQKI